MSQSRPEPVTAQCPACGHVVRLLPVQFNKRVTCPACRAPVTFVQVEDLLSPAVELSVQNPPRTNDDDDDRSHRNRRRKRDKQNESYSEEREIRRAAGNKIAAGICGILLGWLGVHKFILGFVGPGVIMLLVTILTLGFGAIPMGIIGLVEGIIYLSKSDEDFVETYVQDRRGWF